MSKSKYEIFNITTGEYEDMDFSPDDFFDALAAKVAEESGRLYEMYKAEREIVESIIHKAIHEDEDSNRSTD
jgi:hypothetical protein